MGFQEDTGSPELGIESKRTSYRIYDDDGALTQGVFAFSPPGLKGMHNSVEIGAAQLLRLVRFFEKPENRSKLQEKAKADDAETKNEREEKASVTCMI